MSSLVGLRPSALAGASYAGAIRMPKRLILASASPRRKELLALLGLPFEVVPVDVDESVAVAESPRGVASFLARKKAEASWISHGADADVLCIGADTIVATEGGHEAVLGKPVSTADASR